MAAVVTVKNTTKFATLWAIVADVTLDNSYPTGGNALTPESFGLRTIEFLIASPSGGYFFEFDHTNKKLKAINPRAAIASTLTVTTPALTHAAGAVAVTSTAATVPDHAAGAACAVAGAAGVAAGPGAEVANGTDLSAVTTRVVAVGL